MYAKHIFLIKIKPHNNKKINIINKTTLLKNFLFIYKLDLTPITVKTLKPLEIKLFKNKSKNFKFFIL